MTRGTSWEAGSCAEFQGLLTPTYVRFYLNSVLSSYLGWLGDLLRLEFHALRHTLLRRNTIYSMIVDVTMV